MKEEILRLGLFHHVHRRVNPATSRLAEGLHWNWLPCYFNDRWCKFAVPSWPGWRYRYEPYMASEIVKHLQPGGDFIDVGSNLGYWSVYAATIVGKEGSVLSCEASPSVFQVLQSSTANYAWVKAVGCGMGAASGEMEFHEQGVSSTGSFAREVTNLNAIHQPDVPITAILVPLRTLDSLIAEHGMEPQLIKIDVEGYELEVLRGSTDILKRCTATWIIEVHPWQMEKFAGKEEDIATLLNDFGYQFRTIDRNINTLYTIIAEPRSRGD